FENGQFWPNFWPFWPHSESKTANVFACVFNSLTVPLAVLAVFTNKDTSGHGRAIYGTEFWPFCCFGSIQNGQRNGQFWPNCCKAGGSNDGLRRMRPRSRRR